jgi:hypothetical protein
MTDPLHERNSLLTASDPELLAACRVDVFRGSGRGGQKRNRTESAVRVTHLPSGITATSDETRSQHTNKRLALRRLREEIALQCRSDTPDTGRAAQRPARKSPDYPLWLAAMVDLLAHVQFRVADAAAQLDTSTGRLVRELARDPALWQTVNRERTRLGLSVLRMPK